MIAYINYNRFHKKIFISRLILLIVLGSCLLFLMSCSKATKQAASSGKTDVAGIHETYENGPASMTLDTDRKEMTVADRLNLTISLIVDEDCEVTMPDLTGKLEQFGIVDWHTTQPELLENKKKKITRTYVLEPFLSGDYVIPVVTAQFTKKGEAAGHSINTKEITIKVASLLTSDIKEIHDIKPPVPYPVNYKKWLLIGSAALILIAAGIVIWIYIKRRRKMIDVQAVILPPHETAYKELDELIAEDLVGRGEIKSYYQRLSGIIRHYIEDRFGLRAPEQTTEEFLAGLDMDRGFPDVYRPLLKTFLKNCDLVKFAEFLPGSEDTLSALESCRAFIRGTEIKEEGQDAV